ncbi:phosphatidate cytidylyltransferase [Clostridium manihotivorum]|nr:phosphatidate cytidylyltransferase [Clostridium manihotivorum]
MKQRVITSVIGLPILIGIIMTKNALLINSILMVVCLIGLNEFYDSFENYNKSFSLIGFGFTILYYIFVPPSIDSSLGIFIFLFLISLILYSIVFYNKNNVKYIGITFLGFFYVTYMFSYISKIINIKPQGYVFVWLIFIVAWSSDTFAYVVGKTIGKRKLTPELSPNKSVEGFIGGIIGASILSFIYGIIVLRSTNVNINGFPLYCFLIGSIGAIISQCGDLIASLIKRFNGIKDFGKIIPGHGGILDRFDSVILVTPFIYYILSALMKYR